VPFRRTTPVQSPEARGADDHVTGVHLGAYPPPWTGATFGGHSGSRTHSSSSPAIPESSSSTRQDEIRCGFDQRTGRKGAATRKTLTGLFLVLAIATLPSISAAQDCQYHKVKFEFKTASWLDPPISPYDACLEVPKIVGTLNGSYLVCLYNADFIPSPDIYGDTFPQILAEKYYSRISTNKGDIEFIEWAWFDGDFGLETGFAKAVGGTGDFTDAFGSLSYMPRFPNLAPVIYLEGYICTP